jgi:uncharacterized protein YhaN
VVVGAPLTALGGLTGEVYKALFQVDHETLVQGGAELLQGQGEIGASLFAAAAGIASLHRTLADLDAESERLFNPRGRASVLHKRLLELRDAEKRLRDSTLRPARHREMTRALEKDEGLRRRCTPDNHCAGRPLAPVQSPLPRSTARAVSALKAI